MSETATPTIADIAAELITDELLTPYRIAVTINSVLEAVGSEERIVTQMMYTYAKNGLIVKAKKGAKRYSKAEAVEFIERFVNKRISK